MNTNVKVAAASQVVTTTITKNNKVLDHLLITHQNEREIETLEVDQLILDRIFNSPKENGVYKTSYQKIAEGTDMNAAIASRMSWMKERGKIDVTADGIVVKAFGWAKFRQNQPATEYTLSHISPNSKTGGTFVKYMPCTPPTGVGEVYNKEMKQMLPNGLMMQWANEISESTGLGIPVHYMTRNGIRITLVEGW